jgi:hypothetical protein
VQLFCARFTATETSALSTLPLYGVILDHQRMAHTKTVEGREIMKNAVRRVAVVAGLISFAVIASVWSVEPATTESRENWTAVRIFDPFRNETRCVAESSRQVIHDGHQDTTIFLRVDQSSLLVVTESNLDLNRPDVGLRVDDGKLIKPDKAYLDQNALFESNASRIITQFKPGLIARVSLHFWPTWPSKGLKTASFSLIGFSRAFAQLPGC